MIKDAWDCVYGSKSHTNLAGKILLGVPLAPFVFIFVLTWVMLDFLFTKKSKAGASSSPKRARQGLLPSQVTPQQCDEIAEICFENVDADLMEHPEDAADEELSCWCD